MKISNFRDYFVYYNTEYAVVDVETTRFFLFKKKELRNVYKEIGHKYWKFTLTDEFTPDYIVQDLYEQYKAINENK